MKWVIVYFTAIVLTTSCHGNLIKPTYNKGGYTISSSKNKSSQNSAIVYGYVRDHISKDPLKASMVKMGCTIVNVDETGFYKIKAKPIESTFLTGIWIGYRTIETEYFKLEQGDSLNINFFLVQDDRPLINCDGN